MLCFNNKNMKFSSQIINRNNNKDKILTENSKKYKKNIKDKNKQKNKVAIKEDEINNKSNSNRIILFMEDEDGDKNLKKIIKNNKLKKNEINQEKNKGKNLKKSKATLDNIQT